MLGLLRRSAKLLLSFALFVPLLAAASPSASFLSEPFVAINSEIGRIEPLGITVGQFVEFSKEDTQVEWKEVGKDEWRLSLTQMDKLTDTKRTMLLLLLKIDKGVRVTRVALNGQEQSVSQANAMIYKFGKSKLRTPSSQSKPSHVPAAQAAIPDRKRVPAVRDILSELILAASQCQSVISDLYRSGNGAPRPNKWGCESTDTSKYVASVATDAVGRVTVTASSDANLPADAQRRTIKFSPINKSGAELRAWAPKTRVSGFKCSPGTMPAKYLGDICGFIPAPPAQTGGTQ